MLSNEGDGNSPNFHRMDQEVHHFFHLLYPGEQYAPKAFSCAERFETRWPCFSTLVFHWNLLFIKAYAKDDWQLKLQLSSQVQECGHSHLLFADDLFIFCCADAKSVSNMINTFQGISKASGLEANPRKSNVYISGVDKQTKDNLLSLLKIEEVTFAISIFGYSPPLTKN